jgi:ion channel-forming bestrophin family protein
MQMHGSILPKLIVPLFLVGGWTTMITCLHFMLPGVDLGISNAILTVTGFVVGLGLSFRSATAYERYAEGRRHWGELVLTCQSLGRCFWVHTLERPGLEKQDLLGKL